jgi:hypothetical protein
MGTELTWCTFLEGSARDEAFALDLDPGGCPVVSGGTKSAGFPTTGEAYDRAPNGERDAFLVRLRIKTILAVDGTITPLTQLMIEPNPFRTGVNIGWDLPHPAEVSLVVLDINGRRVATLPRGVRSAGTHRFRWDVRDSRGYPAASATTGFVSRRTEQLRGARSFTYDSARI